MGAMSIISSHPELKNREETAVYLPMRMTEAQFVAWCDSHTWAEWVDGKVHETGFTTLLPPNGGPSKPRKEKPQHLVDIEELAAR